MLKYPIFGIAISFSRSLLTLIISTVGYFIFNSSALPILQGILITCCEKRVSATGFSYANIFTQIFTSGPMPFVYGAINDKFKDRYPSLAMFCIMFITVLAIPLLSFMAYFRNKNFVIAFIIYIMSF